METPDSSVSVSWGTTVLEEHLVSGSGLSETHLYIPAASANLSYMSTPVT